MTKEFSNSHFFDKKNRHARRFWYLDAPRRFWRLFVHGGVDFESVRSTDLENHKESRTKIDIGLKYSSRPIYHPTRFLKIK